MLPQPLHPAVVHFPIVLAFLVPAAVVYALVAMRRGGSGRPAWIPVVVLAALLSVSAWVSVNTGESQEDVTEAVVPEAALHAHEEAAERFLIGSGLLLGLAILGLGRGSAGRALRGVTAAASLAVLVLGFQVGKAGGELVYTHGAAQAWTERAAGGGADARISGRESDADDDGEAARSARR